MYRKSWKRPAIFVQKQYKLFEETIGNLCMQPIGIQFQRYATAAKGVAEQLGKKVHVNLKGTDVEVSYERLESLFTNLVHLVRNSVDHGIEDKDIRSMLGKPEAGTLIIKAEREEFQENGLGNTIDLMNASQEDLVNVLFSPGFSTKEEVTEVSGRGAGLDAVKYAIDALKGTIQVTSKLDEGTTFELFIPDDQL